MNVLSTTEPTPVLKAESAACHHRWFRNSTVTNPPWRHGPPAGRNPGQRQVWSVIKVMALILVLSSTNYSYTIRYDTIED